MASHFPESGFEDLQRWARFGPRGVTGETTGRPADISLTIWTGPLPGFSALFPSSYTLDQDKKPKESPLEVTLFQSPVLSCYL